MINRRYCTVCEQVEDFEYDRIIGHSRCQECGARFAINQHINPEIAKKRKELGESLAYTSFGIMTSNTKSERKCIKKLNKELLKEYKKLW